MQEPSLSARAEQIRRSGTALRKYFKRLLTPPLPGDGLLFVGLVEGVIGWGLSWIFATYPAVAPLGPVLSITLLWVALTAGILFIGTVYTAPTVRQNRVWVIWGILNLVATGVNLTAVTGLVPVEWVAYAYWHPWFAVIGLGYLATAVDNWKSPQIRRKERGMYALSGIVTLGLLAVAISGISPVIATNVFVIGGLIQVAPIGYDVLADAMLIARRQ